MKKTAIKLFSFILVALLGAVTASAVSAAPKLTLTPVSGSYTNGSNFTVSIGVNSDTTKSSAVDVWASFDPAKLEVVSIVKSATPPFPFDLTPEINNTTGKFNFSCLSTNMSSSQDTVINGELAVVTFRAKAAGTANLNFVCTAGSMTDSNIFDSTTNDLIDCASNNSGSYTITASASAATTPTVAAATSSAELPKTGGVASTFGLIIFGAVSLASAIFLKFL